MGKVLSAPGTVAFWAKVDGCKPRPRHGGDVLPGGRRRSHLADALNKSHVS
jgi:hypothetical protein